MYVPTDSSCTYGTPNHPWTVGIPPSPFPSLSPLPPTDNRLSPWCDTHTAQCAFSFTACVHRALCTVHCPVPVVPRRLARWKMPHAVKRENVFGRKEDGHTLFCIGDSGELYACLTGRDSVNMDRDGWGDGKRQGRKMRGEEEMGGKRGREEGRGEEMRVEVAWSGEVVVKSIIGINRVPDTYKVSRYHSEPLVDIFQIKIIVGRMVEKGNC